MENNNFPSPPAAAAIEKSSAGEPHKKRSVHQHHHHRQSEMIRVETAEQNEERGENENSDGRREIVLSENETGYPKEDTANDAAGSTAKDDASLQHQQHRSSGGVRHFIIDRINAWRKDVVEGSPLTSPPPQSMTPLSCPSRTASMRSTGASPLPTSKTDNNGDVIPPPTEYTTLLFGCNNDNNKKSYDKKYVGRDEDNDCDEASYRHYTSSSNINNNSGDIDLSSGADDDVKYHVPSITHRQAAAALIPFAAKASASTCLTMLMTVLPLGFIGNRLGEEALAGASVGYFILCMLAVYPAMGMFAALDTLCSQEYGRSPCSDELGLLLQRGLGVGLAFLTSVCVVFYAFLQDAMLSIYSKQTQQIAKAYLAFAPLFLVPLASFTAFAKFNANQQRPHVLVIATAVGVSLMATFLYCFSGYGLEATMLCNATACWAQLGVIVGITYANPQTRQTMGSLRLSRALSDWPAIKAYLRIALPASVFVAAETAAYDVSIMLATYVSEQAGSAWSALMSYDMLFVCVAAGLSAAACAKVGSSVGANEPMNAKIFAWTTVGLTSFVAIVITGPLIFLLFDSLVGIFGGNLNEANKLRLMFPFFFIIDSIQYTFQGVFVGAGLNDLGAKLLLCCLWGVGVPLSAFLSLGGWDAAVGRWESHQSAAASKSGNSSSAVANNNNNNRLIYPLWGTAIVVTRPPIDATTGGRPSKAALLSSALFHLFNNTMHSLDGVVGVAFGIFVGIAVLTPAMIYHLLRVDWRQLCRQQSQQHNNKDDEKEAAKDNDDEDNDNGGDASYNDIDVDDTNDG